MSLLSCANCCFNGLQYDDLGLAVGHCVAYDVTLLQPDTTTCGRHFRKDLSAASAEQANAHHQKHFIVGVVQRLRDKADVHGQLDLVDPDPQIVSQDPIGQISAEYNTLGTKIGSLVRLRDRGGVRAEIALYSLGRTYIRRCSLDPKNPGGWTSGVHLLRWVRDRLSDAPQTQVSDLRSLPCGVPLKRRQELAEWSVIMLRLTLLSDIGHYASQRQDEVQALKSIADEAATVAGTDPRRLLRWLDKHGRGLVNRAFPKAREDALLAELRHTNSA